MTQRAVLVLVARLLAAGCEGIGNYDPKAHAERDKMEAKWAGKKKPEYIELAQGGRIYVVGSQASADKVKAGGKLATQKTAIGYGPNKETVVFEASKEGMEDWLMTEYANRHPGTRF